MDYDELLIRCDREGLLVREKPLKYNDGRIKGKRVAIRRNLKTQIEKKCVLAEEIGHFKTNSGDILDQRVSENRRQEKKARIWGYDCLVGLSGIVKASESGCRSRFETAEFLGVTEDFLSEALEEYCRKYGTSVFHEGYMIRFEPSLTVEPLTQEAE